MSEQRRPTSWQCSCNYQTMVVAKHDHDALAARCVELENKLTCNHTFHRLGGFEDCPDCNPTALIESLRAQLQQKDADHKMIMASIERQRDLNDRQTAKLNVLREDWVKMKASLEFYRDEAYELRAGTDIIAAEDGLVKYTSGKVARESLANLKYKGE